MIWHYRSEALSRKVHTLAEPGGYGNGVGEIVIAIHTYILLLIMMIMIIIIIMIIMIIMILLLIIMIIRRHMVLRATSQPGPPPLLRRWYGRCPKVPLAKFQVEGLRSQNHCLLSRKHAL